jgi:hypothetical protein
VAPPWKQGADDPVWSACGVYCVTAVPRPPLARRRSMCPHKLRAPCRNRAIREERANIYTRGVARLGLRLHYPLLTAALVEREAHFFCHTWVASREDRQDRSRRRVPHTPTVPPQKLL